MEDGIEAGEVRKIWKSLHEGANHLHGLRIMQRGEVAGGVEVRQDIGSDSDMISELRSWMDDAIANRLKGWRVVG
jgi:hypothetical protein